jgi:aminopeptidase N
MLRDTGPGDWNTQNIDHCDLSILFATDKAIVDGDAKCDMTLLHNATEVLLFYSNMDVLWVLDQQGNEAEFIVEQSYGMYFVTVVLPAPLDAGAQATFTFHMQGVLECGQDGWLGIQTCAIEEDNGYGGFYDILPLSMGGDFGTLTGHVTMQAGLVLETSGIGTGVTVNSDGTETHEFDSPYPTLHHAFAYGGFVESKIPYYDGKWVRAFTEDDPLVTVNVAANVGSMKKVLTYYESVFGEFLYPKQDAVQISDVSGAAYGAYTMIMMPKGLWLMDPLWAEPTFAHELAHQWWGDMLKSGEGDAPWLAEGFAEFSQVDYRREAYGEESAESYFKYYTQLYHYVPAEYDFPLSELDWNDPPPGGAYAIVTYDKGAVVTDMLRKAVGDAAFYTALQSLYVDVAGKAVWYDTGDLRERMEAASEQDLGPFFDDWILGKGFPIYRVGFRAKSDSLAEVTIEQDSSTGDKLFSQEVAFEVVTEDGSETFTATVDEEKETIVFETKARPVRVRVDPDQRLIERVVPALPGDLDLSGDVDGVDLVYVAWGNASSLDGQQPNFYEMADFDMDGVIDESDMGEVLGNFGRAGTGEVTP